MAEDYYSTLESSPSASPEAIQASFRRLALRFHPDKNKGESATSDFQRLVTAWEVLGDPDKRAEYDREYVSGGWERDVLDEARQRWQDINREARAQWDRQKGSSADEAERKEKARVWKEAVRQDYFQRLQRWTNFRNDRLGRIEGYRILLRRNESDLEAQAMIAETDMIRRFEDAIERSRATGQLKHDPSTTMSKLIEGRQTFIRRLMTAIEECRSLLSQLAAELECGRTHYEEAEARSREARVAEALEILGPRDMNPPLFCMIDRRGKAINFWKSLLRVRRGAKCFSPLEGSSEGPWHHENWERVVGEHTCWKCEQSAFHIIRECGPARCQGCGMVVCNNCYRDILLLKEYHEWIASPPGNLRDSMFSLDFDASPEPPNIWIGDHRFSDAPIVPYGYQY